ncbi:CBS domain-containing protein [Paenibacillus sp. D51F]
MKAKDFMISKVYKVKESDTVRDVIERFLAYRISGLPVVNERNVIVGYVSDGDIMRYIGKHEDIVVDAFYFTAVVNGDNDKYEERLKRLLPLNVMAIAKKKVVTASVEDDIEQIAAILGKKQIKKLPVHRGGFLAGIISRGDVIRQSFQSLL